MEDVRHLCRTCDVVCLQETWLLPHDIAYVGTIDSGFGYTATSAVDTSVAIVRGRAHGGVALLYRYGAFQKVSVIQCENPRICAIRITICDRPILIICVYMPTNSDDNLEEFINCLSAINAIIDEQGIQPAFVMGDFNADPGKLFYNELMNICNEQQWSCLDVDMLGLDSNTFTFISDVHGTTSWLDHCIATYSAKQSVIGVDIKYDTRWSDHYPLVIECDLTLLTPTILPVMVNVNKHIVWGARDKKQVDTYTKECNKLLEIIEIPSDCVNCDYFCKSHDHRRVLDRFYSDIVTALRDAAVASRKNNNGREGSGPRVVGWNKHITDAHRLARCSFTEWVLYGKPKSGPIYHEMTKRRKIFKSRLKWCQDHQDQIKMDALAKKHGNGDFRGFWRDTTNIFKSHFCIKSQLGPTLEVHNADMNRKAVGISFLSEDIHRAIRQMARGKSPGHDGLSIEHLQHAGPHIYKILAVFYSLCVGHSYLPDDLMKTVVVPVVKNKTGNLADENNYRPISLATIMAKVFDGLLNAQLNKHVTLHDNQFGFRPQLSTESAILCLKHTVKYYTNRRTPVYACFLDLSKALDLVVYDILWEKLRRVGLPQELINMKI
ncbi:unnamed protein product [Euphydryas editha]|uniref:Reverse transcriptase domain-containing protein n=1 Tax=Euphydryas editha TaxID=104508 RepID=A0AAU9V3U3_EUPED|nr:unnamed protein product [Euphydryas editha]